jgi:hypothetical protein
VDKVHKELKERARELKVLKELKVDKVHKELKVIILVR